MKKLLLLFLLLTLTGCANTVDLGAVNDLTSAKLAEKYNASDLKNKYQLDGTALKMIAKNDPKDMVRVTIGNDSDLLGAETEFEPSVKISRWDEVSMKIKPTGLDKIASKDKKVSFDKEKIKFETPKVDYHLYDLPATKDLEEGGYEIEAILKEKPASNVVEFDLETKGLDFFYNGRMDEDDREPEEVSADETHTYDKDGKIVGTRPENVVGSYAVYYENNKSGDYSSRQGGKNYKAGKAGHIYRPKIIDAKGNWVWGEFNKDLQDTKKLTVTIPQDWLNKAVYPVVVDPSLGYTTMGATSYGTADRYTGQKVTASASGTVMQLGFAGYGSASGNADGGIYDTSYNIITNGKSGEVSVATTDILWYYVSFSTNPSITSGTSYWLVDAGLSGTGFFVSRGDTGGSNEALYLLAAYSTPVGDSLSSPTVQDNRKYSIYVIYAPTEAGTYTDTFLGSGTWTAPTGVTSVDVACWGGGAAGSGSGSTNKNGGGGGAYAASTGISVTPGNSYSVVVASGTSDPGTGTGANGTDSSFNGTTVVAKGGLANGTGGAAASCTGTTKYSGGNGVATSAGGGGGGAGSTGAGGNASGSTGGTGTATGGGNGGNGSAANANPGLAYGGGGGGSSGGAAGRGASGACTITYTISAGGATPTRAQQIIIFD